MSSFSKQGYRVNKLQDNKKVKKHIKSFYSIMGKMEEVASDIKSKYPDMEFTEENIDEYANPLMGRDLDSMEKFLILGKLHYVGNEDKYIQGPSYDLTDGKEDNS